MPHCRGAVQANPVRAQLPPRFHDGCDGGTQKSIDTVQLAGTALNNLQESQPACVVGTRGRLKARNVNSSNMKTISTKTLE
jgi:hypothetical protein